MDTVCNIRVNMYLLKEMKECVRLSKFVIDEYASFVCVVISFINAVEEKVESLYNCSCKMGSTGKYSNSTMRKIITMELISMV